MIRVTVSVRMAPNIWREVKLFCAGKMKLSEYVESLIKMDLRIQEK